MYGDRGSAVLSHPAQWNACAHHDTALVPGGGVELTWTLPTESTAVGASDCPDPPPRSDPCDPGDPGAGGGLAFDQACRAYRSFPADGRVEVLRPGDASGTGCPGPYRLPRALAVDDRDRLYVAEYAARTVAVIDLTLGRLLRRVPVGPGRPVDLLACRGRVLVLTTAPAGLLWLEGRRGARPGPVLRPPCPDRDLDGVGLRPARIASGPLVLWSGRGRSLITRVDGTIDLEVPDATDLVVDRTGLLVLSGAPGAPFRRFRRETGGWLEIEPVGAPGFDGGGIAVTPAGRIAYTTPTGYATTTGTAARRVTTGTVTTYRFDSGTYRTRWGRMFLDGCLPPHTSVTARFVTTDDDEVPDPAPWTAPNRTVLGGGPTHRGALSAVAVPDPARRCPGRLGDLPPPERQRTAVADRSGGHLRGAGPGRAGPLSVDPVGVAGHHLGRSPGQRPPDRTSRSPAVEQPPPGVVPGRRRGRLPAALSGPGGGSAARAGLPGRRTGDPAQLHQRAVGDAGLAGLLRRAGAWISAGPRRRGGP